MKTLILKICVLGAILIAGTYSIKAQSKPIFYRGVDLSFAPMLEKNAISFYDGEAKMNSLDIFKKYGCNLIRLRLFHGNGNGENQLKQVIAYAKQIKQKQLSFLLDVYYSDNWADIQKQPIPVAWKVLSKQALKDSIYQYTNYVVNQFKLNNVSPDMIQIGNEINFGIVWDQGKVSGINDPNWSYLAELLKSGIKGVTDADSNHTIGIMIHYASTKGANDFYANIAKYNIPYDIIGISFYPFFPTNDLKLFQQQITDLSTTFNKRLMIVETAYPFTRDNNVLSVKPALGAAAKIVSQYPATPDGQRSYLLKISAILKTIPNNLGIGFCYWAPDWVAYNGAKKDGYKSTWTNMTLFDFQNKALPAMDAFKK